MPFAHGLERSDDRGLIPGSPLAMTIRIQFRGFEGSGIAAEISDRRGVQAGIILLQPAAVHRLVVLGAKLQFEDDRMFIPGAIHDDVVGIEAGSVECPTPASEQSRLDRRESRPRQLIAATGDG